MWIELHTDVLQKHGTSRPKRCLFDQRRNIYTNAMAGNQGFIFRSIDLRGQKSYNEHNSGRITQWQSIRLITGQL